MNKTTWLRLMIDIEYSPNGTPVHELADTLRDVAARLYADGLITGDMSAETETYIVNVVPTEVVNSVIA